MKGVIFNLLQEAVEDEFDAEVWEYLIADSGVSGVYTSLGSYPDEEIFALVTSAAKLTQQDAGGILRWFGEAAIPLLERRYGEFFVPHSSARDFVLSVNEIIHPEVRKLYSGAGCPNFHFERDDRGRLILGYRSPRKLCQLSHGFVLGAAKHYRETVEIEHLSCMHSGDALCRMAVDWVS